jgi:hypothetical protein
MLPCPNCGLPLKVTPSGYPIDCPHCRQSVQPPPIAMPVLYAEWDKPVVRQKKPKSNNRVLYVLLLLAACVSWGVYLVIYRSDLINHVITPVAITKALDPDLQAVRSYLRENLDDPYFEEVRWWPARRSEDGVVQVCRLKYRTKSLFGILVLRDDVFRLDNGKWRPIDKDYLPPQGRVFED